MSQLINRNDTVTFVSVLITSLTSLAYSSEASITIDRNAKALSAGEKQIKVEYYRDRTVSSAPTINFKQDVVNTLPVLSYLESNPFHDPLDTCIQGVFTSDVSDDEIRNAAAQWCQSVLAIFTEEINKISLNLGEINDRASNAESLFTDS